MRIINEIEVYSPGDPSVGLPDFSFRIIPDGDYLIDLDEIEDTEEGAQEFQKALKAMVRDLGEWITGDTCKVHFVNYEEDAALEEALEASLKRYIAPQDTML